MDTERERERGTIMGLPSRVSKMMVGQAIPRFAMMVWIGSVKPPLVLFINTPLTLAPPSYAINCSFVFIYVAVLLFLGLHDSHFYFAIFMCWVVLAMAIIIPHCRNTIIPFVEKTRFLCSANSSLCFPQLYLSFTIE